MQEQISIYPLGCEPFCARCNAEWDGHSHQVDLYPGPEMTVPACSCCDRMMHIQDRLVVRLRTMPVNDHAECYWNVHYRRFRCPTCGKTEYGRIPFHFVGDGVTGAKLTVPFARFIWRLLDGTSIKKVAETYHLRWNTVKAIELFYMKQALGLAGISEDIEYLGIDEKHIGHVKRKHHYITIVSSLRDRRPIWICDGKRIEDVMPFFEFFGEERLGKVKAISMDANAGYATAFSRGCPNAVPVLDHFHIIQDYGRDCLGKIRIRLWHDLEEKDRRLSKKFKDSLRTSLSREEDLSEKGRKFLDGLREASKDFDYAIICLYALRKVYEEKSSSRKEMADAWDGWVSMALATEVPEIVSFANNKDKASSRDAILNYADHRISNGPIEGVNGKIDKIFHAAYGLRDMDYIFTKIKFIFLPEEFRKFDREWSGDSQRKRNSRKTDTTTDSVF